MFHNRVRFALAFIVLALGGFLFAEQPQAAQVKDPTVYITKTGDKYHNSGCRSLAKSKIAILLSDAKIKYGPCSVCKPPR